MPSGVDAQSWLGFEHRIQERRFKALLDTIRTAVAQRDSAAARAALEEARELRPEAPELRSLAARIAVLPIPVAPSASPAHFWYRAVSAVGMFLLGIGLVIGIEAIHPAANKSAAATVAKVTNDVASLSVTSQRAAAPVTVPDPEPPAATNAVTALPVIAASGIVAPRREEPVGTAGVSRASRGDAGPAAVPNRQTFRPAVESPSVLPASREVSDDYIAPSARSDSRPGYADITPAGPPVAANVMSQPVSITAAPPVLTASNANVTSPSVVPRGDTNRVAQVLNQYARAYAELDPDAARAVWPTVDERALSRAFASLESQDVSFDSCNIDVKGTLASATCRGTASYVGKVGSRQARTESRLWNFELRLHGDDWKIEKAEARQAAR